MRIGWIGLIAAMLIWPTGAIADDANSRTFEFEYCASMGEADGMAKMWIPLPQDTADQAILEREIETDAEYEIVREAIYGNEFILLENEGGAIEVALTFRVNRKVRAGADAAELSGADRSRYLQPSQLIKTTGPVMHEAFEIAGHEKTNHDKAKKLYDNIVNTVRYDKSGDGWGRGDALYACDARAGNCTDFHSLFIGEARALGVPSRFLMGFSVPNDAASGDIGGYHCWAEYYEDDNGWSPLDASEAFKDQSRREELFGGLDANRVQFTMGRDLVLPEMQGEPRNFVIYPYAEVDGASSDAVTYSFRYRAVN